MRPRHPGDSSDRGLSLFLSWRAVWAFGWLCVLAACGQSAQHDHAGHDPRFCAHCGMKVAEYPRWRASAARAGDTLHFCTTRCLLLTLHAKAPDYVQVQDYYTQTPTDGLRAWYVSGSDVTGPMGRDFIAFGDSSAAAEFWLDHGGQKPLRWQDLDAARIAAGAQ